MLFKVGQVVDSGIIQSKHRIKFRANVFINPFIDKTDKHISIQFVIPVFEY